MTVAVFLDRLYARMEDLGGTMSRLSIVETDQAPAAIGAYSQGVICGGVCYFSGQIGLDPKNMDLQEGFDGQLQQILKNIDGLLKSQNLTRKQVVKTTIFLTDLGNFTKVNQAYENFFTKPYPARSCVQASALPKDAMIEIEVVAVKDV